MNFAIYQHLKIRKHLELRTGRHITKWSLGLFSTVMLQLAGILVTIFILSYMPLRLRQRELKTIFKLGCSRMTITYLLAAEILIIGLLAGALCIGLLFVVDAYSSDVVRRLFIN